MRRWSCLLAIALAASGIAGCHYAHPDYATFSLSVRYERWARREGLLALHPIINPFWWLGVGALALDLAISPFTMIYDYCLYATQDPGRRPPPWAVQLDRHRWKE